MTRTSAAARTNATTVTAEEIALKAAMESACSHLHAAREEVAAASERAGDVDDKITKAIDKAVKRLDKAENLARRRLRRADKKMYGDR